jgi:hypothetical protein
MSKCGVSVLLCAGLIALGLSAPARASTYDLSFTNNQPGDTSGTITLEVEGLTNNSTTGFASDVILLAAPSALGLAVGDPPTYPQTYPIPFDFFASGAILANSNWTVTNGVITAVDDFSWSSNLSRGFVFYIDLDSNVDAGFYAAGSSDGEVLCEGSSCLVPLAPTPVPAAAPLFATGFGIIGMMGYWRRKRKDAAAIAAA